MILDIARESVKKVAELLSWPLLDEIYYGDKGINDTIEGNFVRLYTYKNNKDHSEEFPKNISEFIAKENTPDKIAMVSFAPIKNIALRKRVWNILSNDLGDFVQWTGNKWDLISITKTPKTTVKFDPKKDNDVASFVFLEKSDFEVIREHIEHDFICKKCSGYVHIFMNGLLQKKWLEKFLRHMKRDGRIGRYGVSNKIF